MMKRSTLNRIIRLAEKRRKTAIGRLRRAQQRQDEVLCDQIAWQIAGENELIGNAQKDLKILDWAEAKFEELFGNDKVVA